MRFEIARGRTVKDQSGVAAWSDLTTDLGQMQ
jgi:hypothetical protein